MNEDALLCELVASMKGVERVAKKQGKNQKRLVVSIRQIASPGADAKLSRVVNILLKAATRGTIVSEKETVAEKEKSPHHIPREEGLTGGHEESDSNE